MKGMSMERRTERDQAWSYELHKTADGYGLTCARKLPFIHKWVVEGLCLMLGCRYCAGIALHVGVLQTRHRSARGRENATGTCDCCGPGMEEHLGHILQVCPQTHGPQIKRHNLIVEKIRKKLAANGWTVLVEPLIKSSGVAVEGDGFDPDTGHERKVAKYSVVPEITALVQRSRFPFRNANQVPTFTAFVSNWRGVLSRKSSYALLELGCFRKTDLKLLSVAIVQESTWVHQMFHWSTYRCRAV